MPAKPSLWAALVLMAAVPILSPSPAFGAAGELFPEGKSWCASTHPNHGTPQGFGPALDMGSPTDFRWPVLAPGDGRVRVYSRVGEDGWGNSVMWTSKDGRERIHLAHLDSIEATGAVRAGDMVGRVGSTGRSTSPHLHASRRFDGRPAPLILGGQLVRAGDCRVSAGAIPPTCFGKPATIVGTPGRDVLIGTRGDDVIVGLEGADRIEGRGGDDRICGGPGPDVLIGGPGRDALGGGPGKDRFEHGPGGVMVLHAYTGHPMGWLMRPRP